MTAAAVADTGHTGIKGKPWLLWSECQAGMKLHLIDLQVLVTVYF